MKLSDLRQRWESAGGGVYAALELDNGKYLLPLWEGDHSDFCETCDHGGSLLCCDFCEVVSHPRCLTSPVRGVTHAKYWACDSCSKRMWRNFAGIRTKGSKKSADNPSPFIGVSKCGEKWEASFMSKSGRHYLGCFDSPEEAARAHDIEARKCFGDAASTNFSITQLQHEDEYVENDGHVLRGVCFSYGSWRSSIVFGHGMKHLGYFDSKQKAALAYDRAAKYYHGTEAKLNYPNGCSDLLDEGNSDDEESSAYVKEVPVEQGMDSDSEGTSIGTSVGTSEGVERTSFGSCETSCETSCEVGIISQSSLSESHSSSPLKSSKGYWPAPANITDSVDSKLSAEVLDMKQRRARQMVGKWQPPVIDQLKHQAVIESNVEPASVKSEFKWDGKGGQVLDELTVPNVVGEIAMDMLFKHRMDKQTTALALVKQCKGVMLGKVVEDLINDVSTKRETRNPIKQSSKTISQKRKNMDDGEFEMKQDKRCKLDSNKKDIYGWTRDEMMKGEEAFMHCGRNISAAREMLDWPMKRAVCYYYTVWKYSPSYQVWKSQGKKGTTTDRNMVRTEVRTEGASLTSSNNRFRGPRMRTVTKRNYKA